MFVISIKSVRLKKILAVVLIAVLTVIGGIIYVSKAEVMPVSSIGDFSMKAETAEERIAFLAQFGWKASEEPVMVKEVIIPEEFDEVYKKYNDIQLSQGLDLEPFKGVRVKSWCYEILNYPGYEDSDGIIQGNLLIYDGIVVAGDISSTELDGFMHGFNLP